MKYEIKFVSIINKFHEKFIKLTAKLKIYIKLKLIR